MGATSNPDTEPDAATPEVDAGFFSDASEETDGRPRTDGGPPTDGGLGTDSTTALDSSSPRDPICEATASSACIYISNRATSGSGTFEDPFGIPDFLCTGAQPPFAGAGPGDYIYFRGGRYDLTTCGNNFGLIRPHNSGTPASKITFRSYPGEVAHLVNTNRAGNLLGGHAQNYRVLGFRVDGKYFAEASGVEIAYNEFDGAPHVNTTNGNYATVYFWAGTGNHVHHNIIRNTVNDHGSWDNRACAIRLIDQRNTVVEDNYIYNNSCGIDEKHLGINDIIRKNYFWNNSTHFHGGSIDPFDGPVLVENNFFGRDDSSLPGRSRIIEGVINFRGNRFFPDNRTELLYPDDPAINARRTFTETGSAVLPAAAPLDVHAYGPAAL